MKTTENMNKVGAAASEEIKNQVNAAADNAAVAADGAVKAAADSAEAAVKEAEGAVENAAGEAAEAVKETAAAPAKAAPVSNPDAPRKVNKKPLKRIVGNTLVHVFLAVLAFIWVFPIFWIILTSFRGEKGSYVSYFWPKSLTLNNYIKLFTDRSILNFPRMFMNTLIIAIFTCIISTLFVLSVSYCLSRLRFKLRKPYMNLAMILGLFPGFMSMIAVYYILKALGLSEGAMIRVALVLVYSASTGLGFQIAKGFFDTIPKSIDEAAIIDGATRLTIFTKITMPLSKPIVVYTILTSFLGPWVDFIFAKVICRTNAEYYTVAIGLWSMLQKEYIHQWYTCFAAGAVIVSIPIAILFLSMQKYYVNGMGGAVKG